MARRLSGMATCTCGIKCYVSNAGGTKSIRKWDVREWKVEVEGADRILRLLILLQSCASGTTMEAGSSAGSATDSRCGSGSDGTSSDGAGGSRGGSGSVLGIGSRSRLRSRLGLLHLLLGIGGRLALAGDVARGTR